MLLKVVAEETVLVLFRHICRQFLWESRVYIDLFSISVISWGVGGR